MNKYANLVGTNKIKDEYTKINTGFDEVEKDIDALNDLVDALDSRVDTIITTPISGEAATQEIVDARVSAVKSKTFATLDARFEETEQDIATHMADNTAHGLQQVATISLLNGWTLPENKVFSVVKNGNIVTISGELLAGAITDWTDIFILPQGFRPPKSMQIAQKGHGSLYFSVKIANIGNFQFYNSNGISAGVSVVPFNITFSL